ncbi:hypothetical protein D3C71_1637160 [compost metagenome]
MQPAPHLAAGQFDVGSIGFSQQLLDRSHVHDGVEDGVERMDAIDRGLHQLAARERPAPQAIGEFGSRQVGQGGPHGGGFTHHFSLDRGRAPNGIPRAEPLNVVCHISGMPLASSASHTRQHAEASWRILNGEQRDERATFNR